MPKSTIMLRCKNVNESDIGQIVVAFIHQFSSFDMHAVRHEDKLGIMVQSEYEGGDSGDNDIFENDIKGLRDRLDHKMSDTVSCEVILWGNGFQKSMMIWFRPLPAEVSSNG